MHVKKRAVLIFGEGPTDKAFIGHVRDVVVDRFGPTSVKVDCGQGGSPECIVDALERRVRNADFDVVVVAIDSDVGISVETRRRIAAAGFILTTFEPCLECVLLEILDDPPQGFLACDACKRQFHERYISARKKRHRSYYRRDFTSDVLVEARGRVTALDRLIRHMLHE